MSEESNEKSFAFFDLDLTIVPFDTQLLFCNHVLRAEWWRRYYLVFFAPCLPLYALKWLVIVVVLSTAIQMLRTALAPEPNGHVSA